jgi:iron complex transport system ATP-binding protein
VSELRLSRVSIELGGKRLLDHVSLTLKRGELLALLGPNGSGKTTLLRAALGLLPLADGRIELAGRPLSTIPPRTRAGFIGWLPQHAEASEPFSVEDAVASARFRFDESLPRSRAAARTALARVGLGEFAAARITRLSGGERQRAALAALLAQEPELALLDEPGNHLDPAQQIEIYRLLGALWREGFGLLLVTHDVNLLAHLGAPERVRVLGLKQGRVAFECRYADPSLSTRLSELFGLGFIELTHGEQRVLVPSPAAYRA